MAPFERSYAAEDAFKAGIGWLEVGLRGDKTNCPIFVGAEPWRNCLHDSRAKKDQSDARFFFRIKVVDLDIAEAIFPDKVEQLRAVCQDGDTGLSLHGMRGAGNLLLGLDAFDERRDRDGDFDALYTSTPIDLFNPRKRVMLIECWTREPVRRKPTADGLGDPVSFKIKVAIMTENDTLIEADSPYKHDRFPFIPVWGYRNKRTGMPYSPIKPLMGPQEALNHRMSRSLYEASLNQMEIEVGAIDDQTMSLEELREEYNLPDGIAVYADGALAGGKVRKRDNAGAAQQQLVLADQDRMALRSMSGVNEENRGLKSQATSRVAMDAKAERGSVATAELFDNLLIARQAEGDMTLSLAEQFIKQPLTIRVAGEQGGSKYDRVKLNQPVPGGYLNDITARRAHFVVGEQAWKQSFAEAAFTELMQVLTQLASAAPDVVVKLLDVVFEMHPNLPRKRAILERIRSLNGQPDPDGKMSPEQQAAQQKDAAMKQMQFDLQMAQLKAAVTEAQAKGQKLSTDAIVARVTALYEAAQAAQVLMSSPGLTPVADQILASAGYDDQQGSPQTLDPAGVQPAALPAPPQLQQADGVAHGIQTQRADGNQQVPPDAQPAPAVAAQPAGVFQ